MKGLSTLREGILQVNPFQPYPSPEGGSSLPPTPFLFFLINLFSYFMYIGVLPAGMFV